MVRVPASTRGIILPPALGVPFTSVRGAVHVSPPGGGPPSCPEHAFLDAKTQDLEPVCTARAKCGPVWVIAPGGAPGHHTVGWSPITAAVGKEEADRMAEWMVASPGTTKDVVELPWQRRPGLSHAHYRPRNPQRDRRLPNLSIGRVEVRRKLAMPPRLPRSSTVRGKVLIADFGC
jgi:hypothetical protein